MLNNAGPLLAEFATVDFVAVAFLVLSLFGTSYIVENPPKSYPSTHILMGRYRLDWMREMASRDVRIFDAQLLATLRQGTTFFASTSLIAIGGAAAILGQIERVETVASGLDASLSAPTAVWEVKILLVMLLMGFAFLKFVWSIRLYGYCGLMMAALPDESQRSTALIKAERAGRLNILADRAFTRALRSTYFSLAALAWLLGPWPLLIAVGFTVSVIWRREFASKTRALVLEDIADAG